MNRDPELFSKLTILTKFCAEIPSFFCGVTPSKTLTAAQPLNIAFPLGNGGMLRSEEGEGFRKEGDGGEGENRKKKGRAKSAQDLREENLSENLLRSLGTASLFFLLSFLINMKSALPPSPPTKKTTRILHPLQ